MLQNSFISTNICKEIGCVYTAYVILTLTFRTNVLLENGIQMNMLTLQIIIYVFLSHQFHHRKSKISLKIDKEFRTHLGVDHPDAAPSLRVASALCLHRHHAQLRNTQRRLQENMPLCANLIIL